MTSPSIIKTFARLHPDRACPDYIVDNKTVCLQIPDPFHSHIRQAASHRFRFDHVFSGRSSQEEVFDVAAKEVVAGFLSGYNGTIFAYGQTGSGKTYSVHGNASRYENRGIAPRAVSLIYSSLSEREDEEFSVRVSFMEIYQEVGYDLLCSSRNGSVIVPQFPKVGVFEGGDGGCVVRNLSNHLAANEDVAQALLLQGESNRRIAETPLNARSSRSHAVFTISLTARKRDSDIVVKSKLHLVDLAGSERCAKTGVDGAQLAEAKCINLSLHHLEGVIIGLQQEAGQKNIGPWAKSKIHSFISPYNNTRRLKRPHTSGGRLPTYSSSKRHVPYRNSLLTMLLKDSLGGNCLTAMIATINMAPINVGETISTCRFAQRVACIKNMARKNEEIDDKALIKQLRRHIEKLEAQILLLRSGQLMSDDGDCASGSDRQMCEDVMRRYLNGAVDDPVKEGMSSVAKFRVCLHILKTMINSHVCSLENDDDDLIIPPTSRAKLSRHDVRAESNDVSQDGLLGHLEPSQVNILTVIDGLRPDSVASNITLTSKDSGLASKDDVRLSAVDLDMTSEVTSSKQSLQTFNSEAELPLTSRITSAPPRGRKRSDDVIATRNDVIMRPRSAMEVKRSKTPTRAASHESLRPEPSSSHAIHKDRYRSPYEKRQERQAAKLHERVQRLSHDSATITNDIESRKHQIRQEQLTVLKRELEHKLCQCQNQLQQQESTIGQLLREQASPETITNEQLVKRNLNHRREKIEKRLQAVNDKLDRPSSSLSSVPEPKTIEERFPRFVKQNGGLHVNNLLEVLHVEERSQRKHQTRLVNKRMTTMAMELEVKEMATRQRLREFKEKLRQFRQISPEETEEQFRSRQKSEVLPLNQTLEHSFAKSPFRRQSEPSRDTNPGEALRGECEDSSVGLVSSPTPELVSSYRSQNAGVALAGGSTHRLEAGTRITPTTTDPFSGLFEKPYQRTSPDPFTRNANGHKLAWGQGICSDNGILNEQPEKPFEDSQNFEMRVSHPVHTSMHLRTESGEGAGAGSGEPFDTRRSSNVSKGSGYSSVVMNSYHDEGYSQFQRPKFEKMAQRAEKSLERPNGKIATKNSYRNSLHTEHGLKAIPDVNLHGIKKNREVEIEKFQTHDIEEFMKKLENVKLHDSFVQVPNPNFSKLDFPMKTVELPKREFQEKLLTESSQKLLRNLSFLGSKGNEEPGPSDKTSPKRSDSKMRPASTSSDRRSSRPRNSKEKSDTRTSESAVKYHSAMQRRHSKSEFKIDWAKGLIHINGNGEIKKRPGTSESTRTRVKSNVEADECKSKTQVSGGTRADIVVESNQGKTRISNDRLEIERVTSSNGNDTDRNVTTVTSGDTENIPQTRENRGNSEQDETVNSCPWALETGKKSSYLKLAREQKERVQRMRKVQASAEVIQRAWRKWRLGVER